MEPLIAEKISKLREYLGHLRELGKTPEI